MILRCAASTQPVEESKVSHFRAAASNVNITPPIGVWLSGFGGRGKGADAVADDLFAKALVLSDGETEAAVVTTDLLAVPPGFADKVKSMVEQETGLPQSHLLICASHTHYGPMMTPPHPTREVIGECADAQWLEVAARKTAGAVLMAHGSMREARISAATGALEGVSYNRRTLKPDGKVEMSWLMPEGETDLTFGPIDPDVGLLRAEDTDGASIATLVNFACHPVCGNGSYAFSADYPGYAMRLVESVEGGVCLFTLGCAGDINPIYRGEAGRRRIGVALGAEALKLTQKLGAGESAKIAAASERVELPLLSAPPLEEARKEAERVRSEYVRLRREGASEEELAEARRNLFLPTRLLGRAERLSRGPTVSSQVQVIRIGETALVGLPGQEFVETGLEIKRLSPFEQTFVINLANDELSYVPPPDAYDRGGYEQEYTFIGPGADKILCDAVRVLSERLAG